MTANILIYGATGYTGRLISLQAKRTGLDFEIAGRNENDVQAFAKELGVTYRVFALNDALALRTSLANVKAVLNCAGPFANTAEPLMQACIESGIHYLDIAAEYNVYALADALSQKATAANVMLLPGVGWDVVPSDCLAVHTAARVAQPQRLRIALQVAGSMSRGSALSATKIMEVGLLVRSEGKIVSAPDDLSASFDFGEGMVECARLSFGDLVTAWRSTGIPSIEMFVHVKDDAFPTGDLSLLPDGPSEEARKANRARAVAEVTGIDGHVVRSRIDTLNGYTYTPLAVVEAAHRVLAGQASPGLQTPALLFGSSFASSIRDTFITDIPPN